MKKSKSVWLLLAVLILFIGGAAFLYHKLSPAVSSEQLAAVGGTGESSAAGGDKQTDTTAEGDADSETEAAYTIAPDFTAEDSDGNEIKLSDFVGKPVVLNFWASWCGPCKSEMPAFDAAFAEYGADIHFLMVNMTDGSRETKELARTYIEEQGYAFPVYYDTQSSAALAYYVTTIPATYFIDADGHVIARASSALDAETLQKGIDMIR